MNIIKMASHEVLNIVYEGAVISAISIGYMTVYTKLMKRQTVKYDFSDFFYIAGSITGAINTKNILVKKGILPISLFG